MREDWLGSSGDSGLCDSEVLYGGLDCGSGDEGGESPPARKGGVSLSVNSVKAFCKEYCSYPQETLTCSIRSEAGNDAKSTLVARLWCSRRRVWAAIFGRVRGKRGKRCLS